jgi:hypothetical protein
MLRKTLMLLALAACGPPTEAARGVTLVALEDAGSDAPADAGPDAPAIDAAVDGPPDGPPVDAEPVEVHPPGPFVTWSFRVRQVVPYAASAGTHVLTVRITGNNGRAGEADGATLSIDGGEPCPAQVRPLDWPPNPIGGTTVCSAEVVATGSGDSVILDMREWNGDGGWDVQHEYLSLDGGPWVEVTVP